MKRQLARSSCVASVASVLLLSTFAASTSHALEMDGSMYVVAAFGHAKIDDRGMVDSNDSIIRTALPRPGSIDSTASSASSHGHKLQLGYEFNPYFAIEGGYVDLGKFEYTSNYTSRMPDIIADGMLITSELVPDPAQRQMRAKGWNIAGVATLPLDDEWSLFGKVGILRARTQATDSSEYLGPMIKMPWLRRMLNLDHNPFGAARDGSANKWSPNLGIGVNYRFSETLGMRFEAERFSKVGKADVTGSADIDLVTLGVTASF